MARITKKTKQRLRNLYLNIKLRHDISKFVSPNSTNKQSFELNLEKNSTGLIKYLISRKLLKVVNNAYQLTNLGKFVYLMSKYNINFLELCFLLETYCCEKRMRESCKYGFYVKYSFYEKMEDLISYGTLSNAITSLCKKGLIYKHHKASYSITPNVFIQLSEYQNIVDIFHQWFIDMWRKKNELILQDSLIRNRQREYFRLSEKIVFR